MEDKHLNVVFVSSEAVPFAKTGGLADVSGTLPVALKKVSCKVTLFLPFYRQVLSGGFEIEPTGLEVSVPLGRRELRAEIMRASSNDLPVYLIKRDEFFDRSYLYGTPEGDYFDNLERFTLFSRAVVEAIKTRGFKPHIIHCNDWQTGLIPAYLKDVYRDDPFFTTTATVFTIHNIAYQGIFPPFLFELTGLNGRVFTPEGMEFWGNINLLKAGIVFSDIVTTVSSGYSKEIQTPEYGYGLDGVLRARRKDLHGVVNGVDYSEWDPEKDGLIRANYSEKDLTGKRLCKEDLLEEFDLRIDLEVPLIGIISRLADQKGMDILSEAMEELMSLDLAMVVLGTGDRRYQDLFEGLSRRWHGKLGVKITFDNRLAHKIEAGCDMILMPSRYEPCGLNQIYSLKYGTVPIVRATGGLDDTIEDYRDGHGTGFKFRDYTASALVAKVKEALSVYRDKRQWTALQRRGMKKDFSWENSARRYKDLYNLALEKRLHKS